MNNMLFLGDSGMPIPSVPTALPITYPDVNKINFDPPGYAQRPPATLGPIPIKHSPNSIDIKSLQQLQAESVSPLEKLLDIIRPQVSDIYGLLQTMPGSGEREMTIKVALDALRPGSNQRVKTLSDRLIASGLPAENAFREALAREIAATLVTGVTAKESAAGIGALNAYFPPHISEDTQAAAGLGGIGSFFKKIYRGAKKLVKKAIKIVKNGVGYVAGVIRKVACSDVVKDAAGAVSSVVAGNSKAGRKGVKSVCDQTTTVRDMMLGTKTATKKSGPSADELRRRETEERLALLERQSMYRQPAPAAPAAPVIIQAPAQPQVKQSNVGLYTVGAIGALALVLVATRGR